MTLLEKIRERRVPQYLSAYIAGGWVLIQFITFLEGRMGFSPHLVNLLAIALVLMLPGVAILAWRHGRPGPDTWGRVEFVSIPANLLVVALVLFLMFQGKDLRAITENIELKDENGELIQRTVVREEYRRSLQLYYFKNEGDPADDWMRQGLTIGIATDLGQDASLDVQTPINRIQALRHAEIETGLKMPRPLMRKIAQDAHCPRYLSGTINRRDGLLVVEITMHDTDKGRVIFSQAVEGEDFFAVADELCNLIRDNLDIPPFLKESYPDQALADLTSGDLEAYRLFVESIDLVIHHNDWEKSAEPISKAVSLDPTFAMAHFMRYNILFTNGDADAAHESMDLAIKNLYRLAERSQFMIKAMYYLNVKSDADKAMAVLDMWTRIYPNDVAAYQQISTFAIIRNDRKAAIDALETILSIDSTQHQYLMQLANLYVEEGQIELAEPYLLQYAELYPTDVRSFTQLASLHEASGQIEQARQDLEQALVIQPDDLQTLLQQISLDLKLGHFDRSISTIESLLNEDLNDQDRSEVVAIRAAVSELTGRNKEATGFHRQWRSIAAKSMNPHQLDIRYGIMIGRLVTPLTAEDALLEFKELRAGLPEPNNQMMGMCEAEALMALGRWDEAEKALAETETMVEQYKLEVLKTSTQRLAGLLAEERGELPEALLRYRDAYERRPNSNGGRCSLARALHLTGEDKEARELLESVLERYPSHPKAHLEMAQLLKSKGKNDEAMSHLAKAQEAWDRADEDHPGAVRMREMLRSVNIQQ